MEKVVTSLEALDFVMNSMQNVLQMRNTFGSYLKNLGKMQNRFVELFKYYLEQKFVGSTPIVLSIG